jgi:hypothetical protein
VGGNQPAGRVTALGYRGASHRPAADTAAMLPSLFVAQGCRIVATDQPLGKAVSKYWSSIDQHADSLDKFRTSFAAKRFAATPRSKRSR